jgi:hypothetical protein
MAAIALAIFGKNNSSIYLREFISDTGGDSIESPNNSGNDYDNDEGVLFGMEPLSASTSTSTSISISTSTSTSNDNSCCSVRHRFVLHSALDRLEQLTTNPDGTMKKKIAINNAKNNNFLGLLLPIEETRVYGYITNTQIKFILIVEDDDNIDVEIQRLFNDIHESYIQDIMNPFREQCAVKTNIATTTCSNQFDDRIQKHIANFNQSDGMI